VRCAAARDVNKLLIETKPVPPNPARQQQFVVGKNQQRTVKRSKKRAVSLCGYYFWLHEIFI